MPESELTKPEGDKKKQSETHLAMMIQKVMGEDAYVPTAQQVDEILSQKRQVNEFIRDDRKDDHEKFKISSKTGLHYFYGSLVFVVLIAGLVLWKKPEYFTEVLSALLGFAGGYGVGQWRKVTQ